MITKKIYTICFALFLCISAKTQGLKTDSYLNYQRVDYETLHFGFSVGVNYMDYNFRHYEKSLTRVDIAQVNTGFNIGVVVDYRLDNDFSLRLLPGIEFGKRQIIFVDENKPFSGDYEVIQADMPILIKYKSHRYKNMRPYLVSGFGVKYNMQGNKELNPDENILIKTLPLDYYWQFGFGIDWYLPFSKVSTELRFSIGLRNLIDNKIDNKYADYTRYTDAIKKINSKIVSIVIHFE